MKKITSTFLTAAICLAAHAVCDAQFITLGLKASGGASTVRFDFDRDFATAFVPSYSLGGAFNFQKTDRFWFGFELLYSRSGYRYPQSHFLAPFTDGPPYPHIPDTTFYATINETTLSYVQIPVFAAYSVKKFYVEGGAYCGLAVGGKMLFEVWDWNTRNGSISEGAKIKFTSKGDVFGRNFRRFDYGLRGEMGFDFKLSKSTLRLSASYQQGLANLLPSLPDSGSRYKARHQALSLGLTYFFRSIPLHTK